MITELDVSKYGQKEVKEELPAFIMREKSNPFIIMKDNLSPGTTPLRIQLNGVDKVACRILDTPVNVKKLLSVLSVVYLKDVDGVEHEIKTIHDYLKVV